MEKEKKKAKGLRVILPIAIILIVILAFLIVKIIASKTASNQNESSALESVATESLISKEETDSSSANTSANGSTNGSKESMIEDSTIKGEEKRGESKSMANSKFRNENIKEQGYVYGKWMTAPGVYTISYSGVYCYLIVGSEKALLFDTAYGEGNLRDFVEEITEKPLYVVNSHGHFDHTGGNPWWDEVYAGPGAEKIMKKAFSPEMQVAFDAKPYPDYKVNTVKEGDVFDLGDRKIEVFEIPAHHESSIALLDHKNRALYTGDEMEAGQVLLFVRDEIKPLKEVVSAHKSNMEKLKGLSDKFDVLYPAHNGPQLDSQYIDDFIALSQSILDGNAQIMPDLAGFGFPPTANGAMFGSAGELERAQYGGASFVYIKE